MSILTIKQIIFRITIVISITELMIMLMLSDAIHTLGAIPEALIDASILVIVASPIIYIWVIKPFVNAHDKLRTQLSTMAYSDQLTGLSNRYYLTEYLERYISQIIRHKHYGAIILIDLDNFKPINDTHGHSAGDAVLIEISKRLQDNVRKEDLVSRVGGDEFIVLLNRLNESPEIACKTALHLAEKLQKIMALPIIFNQTHLQVTSCSGIRLLGVNTTGVEAAIREADFAMYKAKEAGKNGIVVFDHDIESSMNSGDKICRKFSSITQIK